MFSLESHDVIPVIVEAMLPRFTADKVLHLTLRATVARPGEDYSSPHTQIRNVFFVFYRPSNYTVVGIHIDANRHQTLIDNNHVWEVTSDHDSCWRSDGVEHQLSKLYRDMCKLVDPDARPIDLDAALNFGVFGHIKLRELAGPDSVNYVLPQGRGGERTWTIQFKYKKS